MHPYTDHYAVGHHYELIWHYIFGEEFNMCQSKYYSPDVEYYTLKASDEQMNNFDQVTGGSLIHNFKDDNIDEYLKNRKGFKYFVILDNDFVMFKEFDDYLSTVRLILFLGLPIVLVLYDYPHIRMVKCKASKCAINSPH
jgi:hypothetical protein